jgi:hypothetical protein
MKDSKRNGWMDRSLDDDDYDDDEVYNFNLEHGSINI